MMNNNGVYINNNGVYLYNNGVYLNNNGVYLNNQVVCVFVWIVFVLKNNHDLDIFNKTSF